MSGSVTQVVVLSAAAAALIGAGAWIFTRNRRSPEERERRRRALVQRRGRMGEAMITDVRDQVLYYTYEVRGVEYIASQDVTALPGCLPANPALVIGHAGLKYHPKNPANSIVVCEEWSGLRAAPRPVEYHQSEPKQGE